MLAFFHLLSFSLPFVMTYQILNQCGEVNLRDAPWSNKTASTSTHRRHKRTILGGEPLSNTAMPWLVIVKLPHKRICTGTLIAPRYVLTAKHCVKEVERGERLGRVVVGYGNVAKNQAEYAMVIDIFDHPEADISILELYGSIPERPVCLPRSQNDDCLQETMVIAGFGRYLKADFYPTGARNGSIIRRRYGELPDSALWTSIEKLDTDRCILNKQQKLEPTEFCAGGFGSGSMDGDSGGPVMQVVGDRVVQVGVTSRGFQKAINNKVYDAGIYVNLGAYSKWIEKTAKFGTSSLIMSDHCSEYQFDSKVQVFIRDN